MCTRTFIGGVFNSSRAYVYVWISRVWRVAYVGQTAGTCGSLGRAVQHLSPGGTLRCRFEEESGTALENVTDLELYTFKLPEEPEYFGVESSFREAVEYVVQLRLHELRSEVTPRFRLISRVRYTERAKLASIRSIAQKISDTVREYYNSN